MTEELLPAMEELLSAAVMLLPGLLVPAFETALVLLAVRWSGTGASARGERFAGALSLMAGFVAARAVLDWLRWVPEDPRDWVPYLVLLAAAAGLIEPMALRWPVRLAVAAVAAWMLVPDLPGMEPARAVWQGVTAAAVFLLWSSLDPLAARQPCAGVPWLLALATGAAMVVLEGTGNGMLVQLAGALAAILAACAVCSPGRSPCAFARGMVPGVAIILPGLLLNGYLNDFGGVPAASFILALAAPLGLWVGAVPPQRSQTDKWRVLTQRAAVLLLAGAAAGLAMTASGE